MIIVTKTKEQEKSYKERQKNALNGCDICPECNASRNNIISLDKNLSLDFETPVRSYCEHKLKIDGFNIRVISTLYTVHIFHCENCGAVYESEPYITDQYEESVFGRLYKRLL